MFSVCARRQSSRAMRRLSLWYSSCVTWSECLCICAASRKQLTVHRNSEIIPHVVAMRSVRSLTPGSNRSLRDFCHQSPACRATASQYKPPTISGIFPSPIRRQYVYTSYRRRVHICSKWRMSRQKASSDPFCPERMSWYGNSSQRRECSTTLGSAFEKKCASAQWMSMMSSSSPRYRSIAACLKLTQLMSTRPPLVDRSPSAAL
mmetsp:Transcript_22534/g.54203  ORF Transcript_22534/g.54203 Transcript_22534/m.54203 type:complete len:205 (+) Transcript_22534:2184-2798(+)